MKRKLRHNLKLSLVVLFVPLAIGAIVIALLFNGIYGEQLGKLGAERLETANWQAADEAFMSRLPNYERKFAYYKVKENQDLEKISDHFGVPADTLRALNPGTIATGTTIKIPPIETPFQRRTSNGLINQAEIFQDGAILHVEQPFRAEQIVTNLPELAELLKPYGAIEQTGPRSYRIMKALSIDDNIRLDITDAEVDTIELNSLPNDITCLCFENSEVFMKNISVISHDPATNGPDLNYKDGRSFIRAYKSARLDMINVTTSYLGNQLFDADPSDTNKDQIMTSAAAYKDSLQRQGGAYGVSWRIPDDQYGAELVTGWVEGTKFYRNHFGAYTYGASGMMWLNNHFLENDVYGLDPHDDSNNAWVEGNIFEKNGKHGFIVSKRCNYNVVRNNVSFGNILHGFMLHQDSVYNVIENNVSYDNVDNYVIYDSDYNTIRNNKSYDARSNHVRINQNATNNYVMNNTMVGGRRGIFVYGGTDNTYIKGNIIHTRKEVLSTADAHNVMFTDNIIHALKYKIADGDRLIFGPNEVKKEINLSTQPDLVPPQIPPGGTTKSGPAITGGAE